MRHNLIMSLVAGFLLALPLSSQRDVSTIGVGEMPTLADLTVGDVFSDGFGCTPCTSYAFIDVTYVLGYSYSITLNTPGQTHQVDDVGAGFVLKFGLPSSQDVGWCYPNQEAGQCVPMAPCVASFWGSFHGGGDHVLRDMDAPGTPQTPVPSGAELSRDCGEEAGIRTFDLWYVDPNDILNNKKKIATILVIYGCGDCTKVYPQG